MTDVMKYRENSPSSDSVDASIRTGLPSELEYVDPDLIFTFGGRAWDAIRE